MICTASYTPLSSPHCEDYDPHIWHKTTCCYGTDYRENLICGMKCICKCNYHILTKWLFPFTNFKIFPAAERRGRKKRRRAGEGRVCKFILWKRTVCDHWFLWMEADYLLEHTVLQIVLQVYILRKRIRHSFKKFP